jgi:hypothetical protein
MTAIYFKSMNYISFYGLKNEFGDTEFSARCDSEKEAKDIIKESGVVQNLLIRDKETNSTKFISA